MLSKGGHQCLEVLLCKLDCISSLFDRVHSRVLYCRIAGNKIVLTHKIYASTWCTISVKKVEVMFLLGSSNDTVVKALASH